MTLLQSREGQAWEQLSEGDNKFKLHSSCMGLVSPMMARCEEMSEQESGFKEGRHRSLTAYFVSEWKMGWQFLLMGSPLGKETEADHLSRICRVSEKGRGLGVV